MRFFGPFKAPASDHSHGHDDEPITDLNTREVIALAPLLTLCLVLGLFPQPLINLIRPDVESIAAIYGDMRTTRDEPKFAASQMTRPSEALDSETRP